ncbi:MAG: acyl-CoA dehydratase activase [Dehalococcoidia bacterium]
MIVAGCDIGSTTGKAVIMRDGEIVGTALMNATIQPEKTAKLATEDALKQAGLSSIEELDYIVGTGYGRRKVPFANENISEITCHGRGALWMNPAVRTVVDIGGQDCKVMSLNDKGKVVEFVMNDRCAAGTGRFFEGISRALEMDIAGISALENQGNEPSTITSQCSVFAESEVVTLINEGHAIKNIIAGINISIAGRLSSMVRKVGLVPEVAVTGGCAKNAGLAKALEEMLGTSIANLPRDPQLNGAIGAALLAIDKVSANS